MKPKNPRGQKKAFTAAQAQDLTERLIAEAEQPNASMQQIRNATLLRVGICSMLRVSDLLNLRIQDVWDLKNGVKEEFTIIQKKTKDPVTCYLSELTISVLSRWLRHSFGTVLYIDSKMCSIDTLAEIQQERIFNISDRQYQNIVRGWAKRIGLDYTLYSTHSIRRTKSKEVYAQTKNLKAIKDLLGHRSISATQVYLGVEQDEVAELARKTKI